MTKSSSYQPSKFWMAALFGSALVSMVNTAASAQTAFAANFDNGTYTGGESLSGQVDPTYGGQWNTNDPDNGGSYTYGTGRTGFIGQTDDVDNISGFSSASQSDLSATLGGTNGAAIVPGVRTVSVDHTVAFAGAATAAFNLDYLVSTSSGSFPAKDTFGFQFGTGTGTTAASLFSINFTPSLNGTATDNIGFTSNGGTSTPLVANFVLNLKYHLAVNVNLALRQFTAILSGTAANGTTQSVTIANNVAYLGTLSDFAATWTLANGATSPGTNGTTAYTAPGNNFLAVDNILVSVPEPSTYVLLGLGSLGLVMVARTRRSFAA